MPHQIALRLANRLVFKEREIISVFLVIIFSCLSDTSFGDQPLQVYILAGQSNMQGHAQERTLEHLGMDAATAPMLDEIQSPNGMAKKCQNVWISSIGSAASEKSGPLTVGYGAEAGGPKIGPELTFGIYIEKLTNAPTLIIKTAWGGKSINTDFRPPSAGPYPFSDEQLDRMKEQGRDIAEVKEQKAEATGKYYRLMLEHVQFVLNDIGRIVPNYDSDAGYELAGFVWFQGWNDMVDRGTYPKRDQPGGYDSYSDNLTKFIKDVRQDLKSPGLPFVIGVLGVGGPVSEYDEGERRYAGIHTNFRDAMAAPASRTEFKGNVAAVRTEKYWDPQLKELTARWEKVKAKNRSLQRDDSLSKAEKATALEQFTAELFTEEELKIREVGISNAAYHYLGSAKILGQIGKAFAESMFALRN